MTIRLLRALAVAGMVLAITSPSQGFEGFLRIDGVKGESTDQRYRDWIAVTAVGWGHQLPVTTSRADGGGAAASRVHFQPVTVSKFVDSASPVLAQMAADGRAIRQVFLDLVTAPGQPPLRAARAAGCRAQLVRGRGHDGLAPAASGKAVHHVRQDQLERVSSPARRLWSGDKARLGCQDESEELERT
jgi:Type VI secretion system effector, Hcp